MYDGNIRIEGCNPTEVWIDGLDNNESAETRARDSSILRCEAPFRFSINETAPDSLRGR